MLHKKILDFKSVSTGVYHINTFKYSNLTDVFADAKLFIDQKKDSTRQ